MEYSIPSLTEIQLIQQTTTVFINSIYQGGKHQSVKCDQSDLVMYHFRCTKGEFRRREIELINISTSWDCHGNFHPLSICWNNNYDNSHPLGSPHQEIQERKEGTASNFCPKTSSL